MTHGVTTKKKMKKKQTLLVRLYLHKISSKQHLLRTSTKRYTIHGIAIINRKSKALTEYEQRGGNHLNSKGEIFFIVCGFVCHPPASWSEEDRYLEVEDDSYLYIWNKNMIVSKNELFSENVMSEPIRMEYNPETGKLKIPNHEMGIA